MCSFRACLVPVSTPTMGGNGKPQRSQMAFPGSQLQPQVLDWTPGEPPSLVHCRPQTSSPYFQTLALGTALYPNLLLPRSEHQMLQDVAVGAAVDVEIQPVQEIVR